MDTSIRTILSPGDIAWFSNIPHALQAIPDEIKEVIEWAELFYERDPHSDFPNAVLGLDRTRDFQFQSLVNGVQGPLHLTWVFIFVEFRSRISSLFRFLGW